MQNDDPKDPLEGKGEEMVPDRGIPFDDIEDSTAEEASAPEEEAPDSLPEGEAIPEETASLKSSESETPLSEEFEEAESPESFFDEAEEHYTPIIEEMETGEWIPEPQPALLKEAELSAESTPEGETEIPFDIPPEEDIRAGVIPGAFSEVPHPWEMSGEEIDKFIGDAEAAFAPPPDFEATILNGELPSFVGVAEYDQPPEDLPDEGMGTGLEETIDRAENPPETMAMPAPGSMSGAPLFSEAVLAEPGPTAGLQGGNILQQNEEQTARDEMLELLVTEETIKGLWKRADDAQGQVIEQVHTLPFGRQMLDHIQTARNELMGGRENYEEAERFVNEVDYRVSLSQRLEKWSKGFIALLYIYEIVWAVALLLVLTLYLGEDAFASAQAQGTSILTYLLGSMIWGGFGGAVGAMLSLVKHIAQDQDFDKQHTWWYINSPPVGVAMGAFIFLIMQGGLISITGSVDSITSPIVIYILAGLAGYQHNVFTDLIKRLMKVFGIEDKKEEEEKPLEIKSSKPVEPKVEVEKKKVAEEIPG
jgi:hypothetical protein